MVIYNAKYFGVGEGVDGRLGKNKKGEGKNFHLQCLKIGTLFGLELPYQGTQGKM